MREHNRGIATDVMARMVISVHFPFHLFVDPDDTKL